MLIVFTLGRKKNPKRDPRLDPKPDRKRDRKCAPKRDLLDPPAAGRPVADSMCAHHAGSIDKPVAISYI